MKSVLSLYLLVGSKDQTEVFRLAWQALTTQRAILMAEAHRILNALQDISLKSYQSEASS